MLPRTIMMRPKGIRKTDCVQVIANFASDADNSPLVRHFLSESLSPNSRRAYISDLDQFLRWGGTIPATGGSVANYLAEKADTHAVATLRRWVASISRAHLSSGFEDVTAIEPVRSTLRGISRSKGCGQKTARPLIRDHLFDLLDAVGNEKRDCRDRALLLVGFSGAFRRSELVGLDFKDILFASAGAVILLRRSKTDQDGEGREIGIPFGRTRHCPVSALQSWLARSGIDDGPLFRPINRAGNIGKTRLSMEAVSIIIKQRLIAIGTEASCYSGHSLRAGFVTSAAQAGVSSWKIRQQTGHASDAMLAKYIRTEEIFKDNASSSVL